MMVSTPADDIEVYSFRKNGDPVVKVDISPSRQRSNGEQIQCEPTTSSRTASTVGTSVGTAKTSPSRPNAISPGVAGGPVISGNGTPPRNPFGSLANLSTTFGLGQKKKEKISIHAPNGVVNPYNNIGSSNSSLGDSTIGDSTIGDNPGTQSPPQPQPQHSQGFSAESIIALNRQNPRPACTGSATGGTGLNTIHGGLSCPPSGDGGSVGYDIPDDATATTSDSSVQNGMNGYALPGTMKATHLTLYDVDDDDNSIATPIPKSLPNLLDDTGLPTNFLRNRSGTYIPAISSTGISKSSSEEDSRDFLAEDQKRVEALRQKREQENVGRLVVKAKQQHNLRMAWFAEAETNALPELPPRKKKDGSRKKIPSNAPPELKAKALEERAKEEQKVQEGLIMSGVKLKIPKRTGPIDLDSGEQWEISGLKIKIPKRLGPIDLDSGEPWGDGKDDGTAAGSFAFTTHTGITKKRAGGTGGFIQFGGAIPEDEDLTHRTRRKGLDRIVCTIGRTRCNLLAFLVFLVVVLAVVAGGTVFAIQKYGTNPSGEGNAEPSTVVPSMRPSMSSKPSGMPSVTPTGVPSVHPSWLPTMRPSVSPSSTPSLRPSTSPSFAPSTQPSLSHAPSLSLIPTKEFTSTIATQVGEDLATPKSSNFDKFGSTVSLSRDGQVVAVGTPNYPEQRGSITVFRYDEVSSGWMPLGDIIEGNVEGNRFGYSAQLSADGLTLVVGEPLHDSEIETDIGRVNVYSYAESTGKWNRLGAPIEGELGPDSHFATSISVSSDGRSLVVGASNYKTKGVVIVYTYNESEEIWNSYNVLGQEQIFDKFGHDVALSGDGSTLAVSSIKSQLKGFVMVYKLNSNDKFEDEVTILTPDDWRTNFGNSISLSWDGSHLAVGSPDFILDDLRIGRVDVYKRDVSGLTYSRLGDPFFGTSQAQQLGYSVSLSEDGLKVAIGSPNFTDSKVHTHRFTNGSWGAGIAMRDGSEGGRCGWDVGLAANAKYVAFGCPEAIYGLARVFHLD